MTEQRFTGAVQRQTLELPSAMVQRLQERSQTLPSSADDLYQIVTLKLISDALMKKISKNYKQIVGFNTGLIALGVAGIIQPATSALLHNTSTLVISLKSMQNLLT